jgi:hypothetical protein
MAIHYLNVKSLSRSQGASAPAAAAYRAGERLYDERRERHVNYSARTDVVHREIFTPAALGGATPDFIDRRGALWNAAEAAEHRRNSVVAREFLIALPHELGPAARTDLSRALARDISDRYGGVVDLSVHLPRPEGDPRNHHAHLLASTREISAAGFGAKTAMDYRADKRVELGLPGYRQELRQLHERWSQMANEHLASAGLEVRIAPRRLREQVPERRPMPTFPAAVIYMERRGIPTELMRWWRNEQERDARAAAARDQSLDARQARSRERWLEQRAAAADHDLTPRPTAQRERASGGFALGD